MTSSSSQIPTSLAGRFALWLRLLVAIVTYVIVLLPIVIIVISSFNPSSALTFPPKEVSLRWYREFYDSEMITGLLWSTGIAIATALASVVLGTLAAVALVRGKVPFRSIVNSLLLSPLIVPGLILGVALLLYFHQFDAPPLLRVLAAHILIGVPFALRAVLSSLSLFDRRIEEAAIIHGASPLRAFLKVTLPSIQPGIVAGAVFAFVASFGEINATLFLTGPGLSTLPVQIYSQIQYGSEQVIVAAASTVQMTLVVVMIIVLEKVFGLSLTTRN